MRGIRIVLNTSVWVNEYEHASGRHTGVAVCHCDVGMVECNKKEEKKERRSIYRWGGAMRRHCREGIYTTW